MAILSVLSVRDVVADTYGRPFFTPNVPSGVRSLQKEVNTQSDGNMLADNPDDFELYNLGTYDDQTGAFDLLPRPELVVRCSSLVAVPKSE